jgi:hypothetical protein
MSPTFLRLLSLLLAAASLAQAAPAPARQTPGLQVSDNKRFLVTPDGRPFFWLGDTAWELFHRPTREDVTRYLRKRAEQRFTVIQAVALAEFDGLNEPNAYGHRPLVNNDPTTPDVKDGPDNDYWDHVDFVIKQAGALGLYVAFLPTWGDKWKVDRGIGPEIFTAENAEAYGAWLGKRYKDTPNIIWVLGGDRAIATATHLEIIRAMARGLGAGDGGAHLMTFHPPGGNSSSTWFHDDEWLDFNMRQNGHAVEFTGRYDQTRVDYDRTPTKPVLDGEPVYEDHPVSFDARRLGHSIASDVRRPLYWDLFTGGFGHTYGHHSVWQMWTPARTPVNNPLLPWHDAIDQPGAAQMQHGRALMESRPFLTRIPDPDIIVTDRVATSVPGAGRYQFTSTRDAGGSYVMVYAPVGRPFSVRMSAITGARVKAWWFNPRTGAATAIGSFGNTGQREFTPPDRGEMLDWILVLDDESKKYPPPGTRR